VKEKPGFDLFLRVKPVKLILSLKRGSKYATILSKEIDCTYSHTVKLLEQLKKLGLAEFEKKGRIKMVRLTHLGEELATALEGVVVKLSKIK